MRYVPESVRILTLAGTNKGRGLQCLVVCPHCGSRHELWSKFYAGTYTRPDADIDAALYDLSRPGICEVCKARSTFDAGSIRNELAQSAQDPVDGAHDLVYAFRWCQYVTREVVRDHAQRPCMVVEVAARVRSTAVWRLQTDSLSLDVMATQVLGVAVPAVGLGCELRCGSCHSIQTAKAEAYLGWPGDSDKSSLKLTTLWYAQFCQIGDLIQARLFKEYVCQQCGVYGNISAASRIEVRSWLTKNLLLDWLDEQMEMLPDRQQRRYEAFLAAGSNLDDHLRKAFASQILLVPHALRDWHHQLAIFTDQSECSVHGG